MKKQKQNSTDDENPVGADGIKLEMKSAQALGEHGVRVQEKGMVAAG